MRVSVVVPCFNEEKRIDLRSFEDFLSSNPNYKIIFVNDGSTDNTLSVLGELAQKSSSVHIINLENNVGKAEAVRQGMLYSFNQGAEISGYFDADLATPLSEIPRLVEVLESDSSIDIVMGSRVNLLGRDIQRKPIRHYLGRVFATMASIILKIPVYDTQCGAKFFRNISAVKSSFDDSFTVKWTFDVLLLKRYLKAGDISKIYELPLNRWVDVAGSKVKPTDFLKAILELYKIHIS